MGSSDDALKKKLTIRFIKVEKILEDSLDWILSPSPLVKIQIIGGKVYSCDNMITTLIQISCLFYFGFLSNTNHQKMI